MVVAAPLIRRLAWPLAALAAFIFLVALALHGSRPDPMQDFKPSGVLTAFSPEEARDIEITSGDDVWRFRRDPDWRAIDAPKAAPVDVGKRIDAALRLLRNSKPLRVLTTDEVAKVPASEYALGPKSLRVRVGTANGATLAVQFGGRNPLGSARYARVEGMDGVPMLPAYVGDAWEQVISGPDR
jgi:hypothetical protein